MRSFIVSHNITSPLGLSPDDNFSKMLSGTGSVRLVTDTAVCHTPAYLSVFSEHFENKFETVCEMSIRDTLRNCNISPEDPRTQFILSTTKGNIGVPLNLTARNIAKRFNFHNTPVVISNACISGLLAVTVGERLIQKGTYDNIVITGADILTDFIVSGFQSLKAIGSTPCRPFDSSRDGINLGECAATVILSSKADHGIEAINGAFNSDANHISGPSRTAEGLYLSISRTLTGGYVPDFINAHGTATLFNDEMEAIGFDRAGLNSVPVNSLKGYIGHTLGAAGIAECIISAMSIENNTVIATKGYENHGVTKEITIAGKNIFKPLRSCLKTASGFGGCNASILLVKK